MYINYTKMCTYFYVVFVFMCIESGWVYALKCVVSLRFFRSSAWSSYWPEKENMSFLPYLIISAVSEWSWSEALTAFSNGRLLQGAGQRLSFVRSDLPPPYCCLLPALSCISHYTHTAFSASKQKPLLFFFFLLNGAHNFSPNATCSFELYIKCDEWLGFGGQQTGSGDELCHLNSFKLVEVTPLSR